MMTEMRGTAASLTTNVKTISPRKSFSPPRKYSSPSLYTCLLKSMVYIRVANCSEQGADWQSEVAVRFSIPSHAFV